MTAPAITLEVLPAGFGDCLLVSCPVRGRTWRMLVDTGPDETYPSLRTRLKQLPVNTSGRRFIDLFVVTHIDHDHIGGAAMLLKDRDLRLDYGDIWFNAPPPKPRARGVAEGQSLAALLGAGDRALPWNLAWSGHPVRTPALGGGVELRGRDLPVLTLLSPSPAQLDDLYKVWDKALERLRRKEHDRIEPAVPEPRARGAARDLEALAATVTDTDRAVPNGSSIAFLLEHRGASVLLGADAFPTVMVPALSALASRRKLRGPLRVDALKLSHHGSRANVTIELLGAVSAQHFIFSTDNRFFKHPNAEAVARVVTSGRQPTLWFNYDTEANRQWVDPALIEKYRYSVRYPDPGASGLTLPLPARSRASIG